MPRVSQAAVAAGATQTNKQAAGAEPAVKSTASWDAIGELYDDEAAGRGGRVRLDATMGRRDEQRERSRARRIGCTT